MFSSKPTTYKAPLWNKKVKFHYMASHCKTNHCRSNMPHKPLHEELHHMGIILTFLSLTWTMHIHQWLIYNPRQTWNRQHSRLRRLHPNQQSPNRWKTLELTKHTQVRTKCFTNSNNHYTTPPTWSFHLCPNGEISQNSLSCPVVHKAWKGMWKEWEFWLMSLDW